MYTVQGFIVFLTTKKNIFVTSMSWTRYQSPQLSTPPVLTGQSPNPSSIAQFRIQLLFKTHHRRFACDLKN